MDRFSRQVMEPNTPHDAALDICVVFRLRFRSIPFPLLLDRTSPDSIYILVGTT